MKTFYPRITKDIPASYPHPDNTMYRISIGDEDWDGSFVQVVKVQMVYNGNVAGRKSPSYPLGTDDWERVTEEIAKMTEKYAEQKQRMVFIPSKEATVIPYSQRIELIKRIPFGKIVRDEDLDDYFKKAYKTDTFRFVDQIHPVHDEKGELIPYWRVVGKGGRVTLGSRFTFSREQKIEHLNEEGIETEMFGNDLVRVINFRAYWFDLDAVPFSEIFKEQTWIAEEDQNTQKVYEKLYELLNSNKEPVERFSIMLNDPDLIKGINTETLQNIAGGLFDADTASESWLKTKEAARKELERRNGNV